MEKEIKKIKAVIEITPDGVYNFNNPDTIKDFYDFFLGGSRMQVNL